MLSDMDLLDQISYGNLIIEPLNRELIGPASVDVVLGEEFLVSPVLGGDKAAWPDAVDPAQESDEWVRMRTLPGYPVRLEPGEFMLGSTKESVSLGLGLAARLEGKSSLGRLGLMIHSTAGFIDPGFSGTITLELSNVARWPILLYPGMRIGQLSVFALSSPVATPYGLARGSKYQGQSGPTPSRSHEGWRLY